MFSFMKNNIHAGNISQIKNSGGRVFNDSGSSHSRNSQRKFSGKLPIYEVLGSLTGIVVLAVVVVGVVVLVVVVLVVVVLVVVVLVVVVLVVVS